VTIDDCDYPVKALWLIAPKNLNYLASDISILSVPDEGRKVIPEMCCEQ
jgi:hypothetical protein